MRPHCHGTGAPRRIAAARDGGERGFTLVETLIAMLVVLVALGLAAQLLLESQRAFVLTGHEARQPVVQLAIAQLREDVRAAAGAQSAPAPGVEHPLLLVGHPRGTVRWERQGFRLWRIVTAPDGKEEARRPMLSQVTRWSWRPVIGARGLVEVEIRYRRRPTVEPVLALRVPQRQLEEDIIRLRLAQRAVRRVDQW